jgi:hypothetical protein
MVYMGFPCSNLLEEEFSFINWKIPKRLLVPLLILLVFKISGALLAYQVLNIGSSGTFWMDPSRFTNLVQNQVFSENLNNTPSWAYAFVGWDSAWYLSILTKGYGFSLQSYAFSPMFPFTGRLFNLFLQNPIVSLAVCSMIFGVLWVPLYQLVAENYMTKKKALISALIFGLSPYVFLFTTVEYTEGLFLFATLFCWYCLKKNKIAPTAGFAAITALTRMSGVIIAVPLISDFILKKLPRRKYWVPVILAPFIAFFAWLLYSKLTVNDFFAYMHVSEWSSMYTLPTIITDGISKEGVYVFQNAFQNVPGSTVWLAPVAVIAAIVIPALLMYQAFKMDKSLGLYFLFSYVGILMFGALVSLPRYISVLFPIWILFTTIIPINKRTAVFLIAGLLVSLILGWMFWIDFLSGKFVG